MRKLIFIWTVAIALGGDLGVAEAFPIMPLHLDPLHLDGNGQIVLASTKAQRDYAVKICRRKFGERFVRYRIKGNTVFCSFRDSNVTITKKALKRCSGMNATFDHLTGIRIKGNQYIARFMCRRRPGYSGAGEV
ncbi:MAG: hypothetical protein ABIN69_14255 [Aestuariivirga sp.]